MNPELDFVSQFFRKNSIEKCRFHSEFRDIKVVGEGAFGIVYRCVSHADDIEYAIKVQKYQFSLKDVNQGHNLRHLVLREAKYFARLDHRNVIRYHQAWVDESIVVNGQRSCTACAADCTTYKKEQKQLYLSKDMYFNFANSRISFATISSRFSSFENSENIHHLQHYAEEEEEEEEETQHLELIVYIQMELQKQTLQDWICNRKEVDRKENIQFLMQIVRGMEYLHKEGLIHRDLKPANIFISVDNSIKIGLSANLIQLTALVENCDFGLCQNIYAPMTTDTTTKFAGTPLYCSPEQLIGSCDLHSDTYSVGLILYEMLIVYESQEKRWKMIQNIRNGDHSFFQELAQHYPEECKLIGQLIAEDPWERPDFFEILQNPLFSSLIDCPSDGHHRCHKIVKELRKELAEKENRLLHQEQIIQSQYEMICQLHAKLIDGTKTSETENNPSLNQPMEI